MKIDFRIDTEHGIYSDALTLPDDHTFTDEEIEAMKQKRVDNWIAVINTPYSPPIDEIVLDAPSEEQE